MKIIVRLTLYGVLILAVFILATSKRTIFNIRSYVVLTGSMEPAIPAGSMVFVQKINQYNRGDVITFTNGSVDITHRIIAIKTDESSIFYQTKGDGNQMADKPYVSDTSISGKVIAQIPYIGRSVLFLKTPPCLFIFLILPGIIFLVAELRNIRNELNMRSLPLDRNYEN